MGSLEAPSALLAEIPAAEPVVGRWRDLRAVEAALRSQLPVEGVLRAVSLWAQGHDQRWQRVARFDLGQAP